ncbi:helix-turn-helix domain-containing protein [Paenibacillus sp. Root444D2]|uniref:helix-turn-helix domain-containing protein n=1 Tax=Paenibacillus sp. Root444D2 TaxID=1736538 RepID=UPI0007109011|nr:helix-turn-helix transcriptional regulator [Paenibacillus sp. Root444D2]KQX69255.1 hypothetical protein ASD40_01775 [Paenibacillus sp. Root444D2]
MLEVKPCLLDILKKRDIKQTELSSMAGIPQAAISRFDNQKQHTDLHLFSIAKALNLNVEDLFTVKEVQLNDEEKTPE